MVSKEIEKQPNLSSDRHLRLLAARTMRHEPKIREVLQFLRQEPSVLGKRGFEFDCALIILRGLLFVPNFREPLENSQNVQALSELGIDNRVYGNTISFLSASDQENLGKEKSETDEQVDHAAESTFEIIAGLIQSGEWGYINTIEEAGVVVSALLIEGWGLFLEHLTDIEGVRSIFVRALEEVLGSEFPDSSLWQEVKPWVIEERELFSPQFIESIDVDN